MSAPHRRSAGMARLVALARLAADVEAARARQAGARLAALQGRRDRLDSAWREGLAQDGSLTVARFGLWTTQARAALNARLPEAIATAEDSAAAAARSEARARVIARLAAGAGSARRQG